MSNLEESMHNPPLERRRRRRRSKRQRLGDWLRARFYAFLLLALFGLTAVFIWNPFGLPPATAWVIAGVSALAFGGVALWRLRERINHNAAWLDRACPQCGSPELKRVHRKPRERLLGALGIPVRRYVCADCRWRGARIDERRV
jgi:hypothetical protein